MDGPNRVYTGTRYGEHFIANRHDQFFDAALTRYGEWSWGEVELWRQILEPGDVVISGGVNIGCHLIALAQHVGRMGSVLGFEPQLPLWRLATANSVLCNVDGWTRVFCAALGPEDGQALVPALDFQADNSFGGLSLLYTDTTPEMKVPVAMRAIDGLGLERLDFLQLDIEGMELHALQGAAQTLRRLQPMLYLEVYERLPSWPLYDFLRRHGYDVWWHIVPMFNPANLKGDAENLWPEAASYSWVCVHRDREVPAAFAGLRALTDGDWTDSAASVPSSP